VIRRTGVTRRPLVMVKKSLLRIPHWALVAMLAVASLALVPVALATAQPRQVARSATVVLRNIAFNPSTVTIRRGGSVRWAWRDGTGLAAVYHTLTSIGRDRFSGTGAHDSGSYTVRFLRPGRYAYECMLHVGMTGTVIVR